MTATPSAFLGFSTSFYILKFAVAVSLKSKLTPSAAATHAASMAATRSMLLMLFKSPPVRKTNYFQDRDVDCDDETTRFGPHGLQGVFRLR